MIHAAAHVTFTKQLVTNIMLWLVSQNADTPQTVVKPKSDSENTSSAQLRPHLQTAQARQSIRQSMAGFMLQLSNTVHVLQVNVKAKSAFNNKLFALNVVITIPVPDNTAKADVQTTQGKAKYDAKKHALVWKIKRFTGQTESALVASVELIATTREKKAWARPPISMSFQVCSPSDNCAALKACVCHHACRKISLRPWGTSMHIAA